MARSFSGPRLRAARIAAGQSVEQLAISVNRSAFSINSYELGRVTPGARALAALADTLNVSIDALFAPEPAGAVAGGVA